MRSFDRNETGGGALVVGYLMMLTVLYRTPESALDAATTNPQSVLYFLVLPAVGVLGGIYAYLDGPFSAIPLFVLGSYLGFFGLALSLGALLSPNPVDITLGVGLVGLLFAALAVVASLLQFVGSVPFGSLRVGID